MWMDTVIAVQMVGWAINVFKVRCNTYRVFISQPIIPFHVLLSSSDNMEPFKTHNTYIKCERIWYL